MHQALGEFISYLEWLLGWTGIGVDYFELTVRETNNSKPVRLEFDPAQGGWVGQAGLTGTGDKTIVSLIAHLTDGSTIDLTDELIAALGDDVLTVRFPEEDTFGNCP